MGSWIQRIFGLHDCCSPMPTFAQPNFAYKFTLRQDKIGVALPVNLSPSEFLTLYYLPLGLIIYSG